MGQSLVKNYLHIIFSTKNCKPLIDESIEPELHRYLCGICAELNCQPLQIGGHVDHVHILCLLSKKLTLISLLKSVKAYSSKWIKTKGDDYKDFFWQDGYGAFSVNPTQTEVVKRYIRDQHEHHKSLSFKDEYRMFLRKYGVDFDERYVWD